jgi:type III restriction enzyme
LEEINTYKGSQEFKAKHFAEIFKPKTISVERTSESATRQYLTADRTIAIDLTKEEWYVFEDGYGTSEEKAFVHYFYTQLSMLRKKYNEIFLVRNEQQLKIYNFEDGQAFEPDYLLILQKNNKKGFDQFQIFIEPKGDHLIATDKWKEDFLLQIQSFGKTVKTFVDDNHYKIWGFPFFNRITRMPQFTTEITKL